jgi:hypothetical protein
LLRLSSKSIVNSLQLAAEQLISCQPSLLNANQMTLVLTRRVSKRTLNGHPRIRSISSMMDTIWVYMEAFDHAVSSTIQ